MALELEALVGHLYIVGGRLIHLQPPGSLVEVAPNDAARGRERDTFFVLITPSGAIAPTTFYQQLAQLAAESYFSTKGSPTVALRSMFQQLNRDLYQHNQEHSDSVQQQFETSMIAAVLHEDALYVARVGPVLSVLQTAGLTLTFPEDLSDEGALFRVPLGLQPEPDIALVHYGLTPGSRLILSDGNLVDISGERLRAILLENDIESVLQSLRRTIKIQSQLILAELVTPEYESPSTAAPGQSSQEVAQRLGEARAELASEERRSPPPPQRDFTSLLRWGLTRLASQFAAALLACSQLLQRVFPLPAAASSRRASAGTLILTSLLIPLLIVALVVFSWVANVGETEFEQCLGNMQNAASLARSLDASNRSSIVSAWNATLQTAESCDAMRPGDPIAAAMREEARTLIDTITDVKRREAIPLINFEGAKISRLRLRGADLYALDSSQDQVYHIKLSEDGTQALQDEPMVKMRLGASHQGFTIGQITDIAFDDFSGDIAMLDENGTLLRCAPQFIFTCDAQRVQAANSWKQPAAFTIWDRKLYVLDSEEGQIWRYDPSGSAYVSAPREYFAGSARPNLRNVVDFTISSSGSLYLLYDDGVLKSYYAGGEVPFIFSGFNPGTEPDIVQTDGFFLNDSPIAPGFFFISRSSRSIFETTTVGTFMDSYQAFDQSRFELLSDLVANVESNILYVASGNTIFRIHTDF